ncbi:MAG: hypothetical protein CL666_09225 [Balneola sp.]|nr:hypothetical protein [Balneola sp.]|tara:strand:- start:187304 stop:187921 length:618 start_codon:yes stop_codon:yes gene_type:complete
MTEFDLLKIGSKKDPLTGKVSFTESIQFKISMGIAVAAILSIFTLDFLDFDVPDWASFLISMGIVFGYTFAFIALLFSQNEGAVKIGTDKIILSPKRNPDKFPESPIHIDHDSQIGISVIQGARFPISRTLLHIEITNDDETSEFGLLLKNKKKHQQYFEVLESWYRSGYDIHEFDQLGSRVFKLNQGKNYADVQKIKQEYGIEW